MKKKLILSLFISFILISIIISPQQYIQVTLNAVEVWAKVLFPALFPFFIFTKILTSLGYVIQASLCFKKVTYRLYKTPPISAYVFFMSILTGYPVGSKLTADLYDNGLINRSDAKKIITFTSNSGPMFIIGSVGIGMLLSKTAGYLIFCSHIIGALLNGLLYRNLKSDDKSTPVKYNLDTQQNTLSSCVMDSINSILLIGGIIIVSFIVIEILSNINIFYPIYKLFEIFGISASQSKPIIDGVFEITKGCLGMSKLNISLELKTIMSSCIISFGGISTTIQAMAFLKNIVTYKFFILQKTTHMIFSTITCAILSFIFI